MVVMVLCMVYSIVTYLQLFVNVQNINAKAYKINDLRHKFICRFRYTAHSSIVDLDQM